VFAFFMASRIFNNGAKTHIQMERKFMYIAKKNPNWAQE